MTATPQSHQFRIVKFSLWSAGPNPRPNPGTSFAEHYHGKEIVLELPRKTQGDKL